MGIFVLGHTFMDGLETAAGLLLRGFSLGWLRCFSTFRLQPGSILVSVATRSLLGHLTLQARSAEALQNVCCTTTSSSKP